MLQWQRKICGRAYVPSTWSLARLDGLADEVVATLQHSLTDGDAEKANGSIQPKGSMFPDV